MDENVFVVRIGPLLSASDVKTLRHLSRTWLNLVDSLLPFKAVFVHCKSVPVLAVRYKLTYAQVTRPETFDRQRAIDVCLEDSVEATQWIAAIFKLALLPLVRRAHRVDVADWLCNAAGLSTFVVEFRETCACGNLEIAQWPVDRFQLNRECKSCS